MLGRLESRPYVSILLSLFRPERVQARLTFLLAMTYVGAGFSRPGRAKARPYVSRDVLASTYVGTGFSRSRDGLKPVPRFRDVLQ